jgi:hypothetical protein
MLSNNYVWSQAFLQLYVGLYVHYVRCNWMLHTKMKELSCKITL